MFEVFVDLWCYVVFGVLFFEVCLINFYEIGVWMGLYQDWDEVIFDVFVVLVLFGDMVMFWVGGLNCKDLIKFFCF